MKMKLLLTMLIVLVAAAAAGDSLWAKNPPGNMIRDTKARSIGDLLTVLIDERAAVSKEANRSLSKENSTDFGVDAFSLFGLKNNNSSNMPALKWDSKKDFAGETEFKSTDTFTKRLTVTVKEVLPNGNLLIEGRRNITTSGDETTMTITGIVRPEDISANNSVPSELVADAKITYDGDGPSEQNTRRGWFTKLLDIIWPF
ncbi:MAG TPA: flagellar basal body L-ring protein FlgH [Planctomycetota bacterium]|nr:flagellar basal body L-ring protein FlgH [Planctomycetota bacterium]